MIDNKSDYLKLISSGEVLNTQELFEFRKILENPKLWDQYTQRTSSPESPHHGLSDIWCRYEDYSIIEAQRHDPWHPFSIVEYPITAELEPYYSLIKHHIMQKVGATQPGVCLITRIPPGVTCKPHIDNGWAPNYFSKYAFQIKANNQQEFKVKTSHESNNEHISITTQPGDLFYFDNSYEHSVTNPSDYDRITFILTCKTPRGIHKA